MIEQYTSPVAVNNGQEPWLVGEGVVVSGGVAIPSLDFNFITGALPGTVTFTRASTATYFDSAGVLQSAAIDAPRFDYDPSTLAARGLLIEEARTNELTYSEEFDDAAWVKGFATISADVAVAPDGATTADKLIEDTSNAQHHVRQGSITVASGATVTVSVFAKAAERTTMQMYMNDNATTANRVQANFDLSAGTSSADSNFGTFTGATSDITDAGNGWYRCVLTGVATGVTSVAARIVIGTTTYTGDGTSGLYIWGAQLEVGAFPTSYIPTTTTALTRSADVASVNTLSPWFNSVQGTIYGEYQTLSAGTTQFVAAITSVSESDRMTIGQTTTAYVGAVVDTGSSQASITQGTTSVNVAKIALAYLVNDFAFSANGGAPGTDTSGTVPGNLTEMKLGRRGTSTSPLSGWLRRITYYPRRLSNAELQSITS